MKIGILGSGEVAQAIAPKMLGLEHEVMISARDLDREKDKGEWGSLPSVNAWVRKQASEHLRAYGGSFAEAARFGELLFNCTSGSHSMEVLEAAGRDNLKGKIMIDLANPFEFSNDVPVMTISNTESLGERIQNTYPDLKVVKTLNHVSAELMTNPQLLAGEHDLLICGNSVDAKKWVIENVLEGWFGWTSVIDIGTITGARAMEMYLMLWMRLWEIFKTEKFNFKYIFEAKAPAKNAAKKTAGIKKGKKASKKRRAGKQGVRRKI
jgi:predicted dinucleotide-binding enzyme